MCHVHICDMSCDIHVFDLFKKLPFSISWQFAETPVVRSWTLNSETILMTSSGWSKHGEVPHPLHYVGPLTCHASSSSPCCVYLGTCLCSVHVCNLNNKTFAQVFVIASHPWQKCVEAPLTSPWLYWQEEDCVCDHTTLNGQWSTIYLLQAQRILRGIDNYGGHSLRVYPLLASSPGPIFILKLWERKIAPFLGEYTEICTSCVLLSKEHE